MQDNASKTPPIDLPTLIIIVQRTQPHDISSLTTTQPQTLGILMNSNTLLGFVILSTILPKSFILDVLQKQGGVQWK